MPEVYIVNKLQEFQSHKIKIVTINLQSVISKRLLLLELISSIKPTIIVDTETWLKPDILNNEIIPDEFDYNIYRHDRNDGYGGVLIAVAKQLASTEVTTLKPNCELLCIKVIIRGYSKHIIGGYFRPHMHDLESLNELNSSLFQVNNLFRNPII